MSSHLEPRPETPETGVIVVPCRPASSVAAKLLPPLLIMLLGAGFLAYRSHAADWRGLYVLFDRTIRTKATPLPKPPEPKPAAPIAPTVATAQPPATVPAAKVDPKPEVPKTVPQDEVVATPPAPKADPIDDIAREAAQTKDKIAALARLKERASEKLDQTARSREQADRLAGKQPRFRQALPADVLEKQLHEMLAQGMGLNPGEIDQRMRDQNERMMRLIEQMQRRQMAWLDEMQRDVFQNAPPVRRIRPPAGFPPSLPMPRPLPVPGFGPNGNNGKGKGNTQFREFRGPNGMRGFEMRWSNRSGDDVVPPPPPPEPGIPGLRNPDPPQAVD